MGPRKACGRTEAPVDVARDSVLVQPVPPAVGARTKSRHSRAAEVQGGRPSPAKEETRGWELPCSVPAGSQSFGDTPRGPLCSSSHPRAPKPGHRPPAEGEGSGLQSSKVHRPLLGPLSVFVSKGVCQAVSQL